jgi:transcriptional regulator of nitric oxide reductase
VNLIQVSPLLTAPITAYYNSCFGGFFLQRLVALIALVAAGGTLIFAGGQAGIDAQQQTRLKRLFPSATTFAPKSGDPPHFTAYAADARGAQTTLGYAFWTTEVVPLERGYGGPIVMLVGMDMKGFLTGVIVAEHHEPYGDFSIEPPHFAEQFRNKDVRDPFKLGQDIDAVSRATITMSSAVRAVRNASRRVARQLLTPQEAGKP